MTDTITLQEAILREVSRDKVPVTLFLMNGFQLRGVITGYDSVVRLTEDERKAIPYVILANQFVCVAWFAGQDKYAELFETNKRMTLWLIQRFGGSKDI